MYQEFDKRTRSLHQLNMADYSWRCEKCGEQIFVTLDYDDAQASNDGENLEFSFDHTCECEVRNDEGDFEECGAEVLITAYAKVHSMQHDEN